MRTEIKEIVNPHFEWRKAPDGTLYKHLLSDRIIKKTVRITYDDLGNELIRENVDDKTRGLALSEFEKASDAEKDMIAQALATRIKKYL